MIADSDEGFAIETEAAAGIDEPGSDQERVFAEISGRNERDVVIFRFDSEVGTEVEVGERGDALDVLLAVVRHGQGVSASDLEKALGDRSWHCLAVR